MIRHFRLDRFRTIIRWGLSLFVLCAAAAHGRSEHPLEDPWRWSHFTVDDGLPAPSGLRIMESRSGVLWVSTANGLAWFDGFQWQSVADAPGAPPAQFPGAINTLPDGKVSVRIGGVVYVGDQRGFEQISLPGETIDFAVPTTDGEFILLTRESTLYQWRENKAIPMSPPDGVDESDVRFVQASDDGSVWLGAPPSLYLLEGDRWILEQQGMELSLPIIAEDGRRFASASIPFEDRGLWSWNKGEQAQRVPAGQVNIIRDIAAGPGNQVVVIYQDGSALVRDGAGWLTLEPDELHGALDVSYATNGDLLVARGDGVGIYRSIVVPWKHLFTEDGGPRNRINEILIASNGTIWSGTDGGVEARRADGRVEFFDRVGDQDLRIITGLGEDDEGGIWASSGASWDGAFRYFGGQWRFVGREDGLRSSKIHRIESDSAGRLWFLGLQGEGAMRLQQAAVVSLKAGVFTDHQIPSPFGAARIYDVDESVDGGYWFCGVRGIGHVSSEGVLSLWSDADGIKGSKVFSIAADAKGRVYFADQRSGLGILENGEVTYFDSRDGLIHDTVQDIEIDEDGTVWLSTRGGLGGYRDGLWLSFGTGSGLQALELWPLATSGSLVYVGSAGKGTFVLDRSLTRGSPPRIVRMDPIVSDDEAVVRWATFADRGRQKRESIQTRHAIDGGQWSDWDLSREIGLHEMAAGRHEVSVQARDEFGTQDDGIKIEFFIESPYYQRPEFFVPLAMSLLAALLLSIALVVRRRRHNVDMRRTEDRFRSFFEEAPISLWEHDYSQVQQFLTSLQQPDIQALRAHLSDHPAQLFECMKRIHVLHVNRATLALFGAESTEELSGQLHRIFRRDSFPAFCEGMMAIHGDQHRFSAQTHAYALSGRPIVVVMSWVVAPDSTEDYKRVLVTLLDITAQHEAAEEMQQAVRVAQEANIAKSSFLANTSHEIRTPINAIMGMAQALQDEGLTEAAEDQVDTILSASDALTHIIDDLLDLSKIEAGELFLESLRFGLAEVIEEVRRTVVGGAAAKGLALAIDIAPGTDTDVVGDPVRIRQVLLNLLSNAIKFTDSGAVRVALSSQRHGTSILLRCAVEDSGMGINPDRLQDIFDPFTQADGSTTRLHGGTGLGLSICRRLVELMDGRIDVESVPGQGSTFRFSVRLQVPQGDEGSASVEVNLPPTSETPPLRILVAEDNELNLKVVRALLRSDHHDIDAVENGQLAVEACQNSGPYDAVLMDVQMPVMDGLTATQLIRKHELASGISRTPIIAVTANAMESDRERCLAAGMDDFVTKPVRKQALRRVLATLSPGTAPAAAIALDTPNQENTELLDPQPLEELRELAELDADFSIQGFVDLFLSEAPKTLAEAYSALDQADLEALHRHVHTLKGSAREIGATRLGLAAQTLEARLKVGDISNCRQSLAELEEILGHVAEALATMVSGDNEKG